MTPSWRNSKRLPLKTTSKPKQRGGLRPTLFNFKDKLQCRFIEIPNPNKGNGLRYGQQALQFVNDVHSELHELDRQMCQMFGHKIHDNFKPKVFKTLAEVWDSPKCRATLMLVNGKPVGLVMNMRHPPTYVAFYSFIVDKKSRSLGYGQSLMQHSIDMHRKLGYTEMCLNVAGNNPVAYAMYKEAGFQTKMTTLSLKLQDKQP